MMLLFVTLLSSLHGASALFWSGVYQDSQWRVEMCCETGVEGVGRPGETGEMGETGVQCRVHNGTEPTNEQRSGICLVVDCRLDDERMICDVQQSRRTSETPGTSGTSGTPGTSGTSETPGTSGTSETPGTSGTSETPGTSGTGAPVSSALSLNLWRHGRRQDEVNCSSEVNCPLEGETSCHVSLHPGDVSVSLSLTGLLNDISLQSEELNINIQHLRWSCFYLQYNVTTEGNVLITWADAQNCRRPAFYQIRYSSNTSLQHWEVLEVQDQWASLRDLGSGVRYTVQVRCRTHQHPDRWTDWSHALHLTLDVSYVPTEIFTLPGGDVTVYAVFHNRSWNAGRAVWMLNGQLIPERHYRAVSEHVSVVTLSSKVPGFDTLMCCYPWRERYKCSIAYAKVYTEGRFEADITCQTEQHLRVDSMTCRWNKSAWVLVRFLYRRFDGVCQENRAQDEAPGPGPAVEECPDGPGDLRRCTLRRISLFSCYQLWLEVEGGHGRVRSLPVFLLPVDHVKPSVPSVLDAFTHPNKTLMVRWRRPLLPAYDLHYELRYVPLRRPPASPDSLWKLWTPLLEPVARVMVDEACSQYQVEVRCRRLNGSGYWSDWSDSRTSSVFNNKAPESGPDYWRFIAEDPVRNRTNVTLLFKIPAPDPDSCVQGLVVEHRTSGGRAWSDQTTLDSFYTFEWTQEVHTVAVLSRNSVGLSSRNRNMTLVHGAKRSCVGWFRAVTNTSCVSLSWTLTCEQSLLRSLVVEWQDLSEDAAQGAFSPRRTQWLRVPSTARDLHLCERFYGTEEFILSPVFVDGEGEPARCTLVRNDPAAYMLVMMIIFLSVVLLVTLISSQNQLKRLMWTEVPNPSNCTWAKGMDFNKMNGTESLFTQSEGLTSCPLLPVSEHVCEVEIIEKLFIREVDGEDKTLLQGSFDKQSRRPNLTSDEGSFEPLSLDTSTIESSGQSCVNYSTVLVFHRPVLLRKQQESLSSSSDEGNFSANNSEISGSFSGNLWDLENPSNPRNSSSYNSGEEFSETSEHEDESSPVKELYYMGMNEEEDEDDEDFCEEEEPDDLIHTDESDSKFSPGCEDVKTSCRSLRNASIYLPQFQTETDKPVIQKGDDSALQL